MCLRSPKPPPPPVIPEPRPPAPLPETTAAAPVVGRKRSSQQTTVKGATRRKADGTTVSTTRTGTAGQVARRKLGTSSLRIPLLSNLGDLNIG